jgi:dihydrofolate synthase/folylpolyglutamate synthase
VGQIGIKYLDSLAPWKGQGGFGLEKMSRIMTALGSPQDSYATIHVGGTNGKGSVSASLSSILGQSGAKVGLNSSPHLQNVTERICIDGFPISLSELESHCKEIEAVCKQIEIEPSFFEAITACAFLSFRQHKVDWAVVEVGLGGRLDATNVILRPKAAVLVSVQHDHEDILGPWPAGIAKEKVEIFKPGAKIVLGSLDFESAQIAKDKALILGCQLIRFQHEFDIEQGASGDCKFKSSVLGHFDINPTLQGAHQIHNAAVAVACARALGISELHCQSGLREVFWPARLECVEYRGKLLLLDCAHNEEGVDSLAGYLRARPESLSLVFSAINTKDWRSMLQKLLPHVKEVNLVEAHAPNAVPQSDIAQYLSGIGITPVCFGLDYKGCLERVTQSPYATVVLAGSMYMIGPMRAVLGPISRPYWKRASK